MTRFAIIRTRTYFHLEQWQPQPVNGCAAPPPISFALFFNQPRFVRRERLQCVDWNAHRGVRLHYDPQNRYRRGYNAKYWQFTIEYIDNRQRQTTLVCRAQNSHEFRAWTSALQHALDESEATTPSAQHHYAKRLQEEDDPVSRFNALKKVSHRYAEAFYDHPVGRFLTRSREFLHASEATARDESDIEMTDLLGRRLSFTSASGSSVVV